MAGRTGSAGAANRREFLRSALGASTLFAAGTSVPTFLHRTAMAAAPRRGERETVLVVIQLAGGNDGLNTVVPFADDQYAKARPTLRLPAAKLHKISDSLGLHPQTPAFARLFKEGLLSIVQGVGYPNPQGGHEESMLVWQTGNPLPDRVATGWIGRTADHLWRPDAISTPAVFVGHVRPPFGLNAEKNPIPAIRSIEEGTLRATRGPGGEGYRRRITQLAEAPRTADEPSLLQFVQRSTLAAYATSQHIAEAAEAPASKAVYPKFQFAGQLHLIAQLIRAELGVRIFFAELGGEEPGGFDTHAGQALNHGALLEQLSESLAAFLDDLKRDRLLDRVLVMTFSEFGRTTQENGRRGTDHGSAQPIFLAGGRVRGGLVGAHPDLSQVEGNGQKFHTDFRRLYATALESWLGFDSRAVLGDTFPPLPLLKGGIDA